MASSNPGARASTSSKASAPPTIDDMFCYRHAFTRALANTFADKALRQQQSATPIDPTKAASQHLQYEKALESLGVTLTRLPADDKYPDCVFVEDTSVVVGRKALICNMGHASRRGETVVIAEAYMKRGVEIVKMPDDDGGLTTMDGGECWGETSVQSWVVGVFHGIVPLKRTRIDFQSSQAESQDAIEYRQRFGCNDKRPVVRLW